MTRSEAMDRIDALITRASPVEIQMVGILTVDETGAIGLSMDAEDDVDLLSIGVTGQRKAGGITIDRDLDTVIPTLEEISR